MIFKKVDTKLRGKWKYQITLIDLDNIDSIKQWCQSYKIDHEFIQNSFYCSDLDIAYKFRIQFDRCIYMIRRFT